MSEKIDRIKKHFVDNKKVYVVAGVTAAVSVVATVVIMKCRNVDAPVQLANHIVGDHNTILQEIHINMCRPGNKAFVVKCVETQQVWPSIRSAAEDLKVNPGELSKHLRDLTDSVKGMHFEKIAEI